MKRPTLIVVQALLFAAVGQAKADLILNPGFETPQPGLSPPNYPTSITGDQANGVASAANWNLFNNANVTTTSELLPSTDTLSFGGVYMEHITTGPGGSDHPGGGNGLYQFITPVTNFDAGFDVYVLSGQVKVSFFTDDGQTEVASVVSTTQNQWERLSLGPINASIDEVVIYSNDIASDFYVDNASISPVPEPTSLTLLGLTSLGIAAYGWRRRRKALPN